MIRRTFFAALGFLLAACGAESQGQANAQPISPTTEAGVAQAVFAGGCFWCMEHDMGAIPGVLSVTSGYTGGRNRNPSYENHPGHYEAVLVRFDTSVISYAQLLERYWPLPADAQALLEEQVASGRLTRRGGVRVHRLALTLADLRGEGPDADDVDVAIRLREGDPLPMRLVERVPVP